MRINDRMTQTERIEVQTERIRLWGIVQGVGFRPYVAKTAESFAMKGEVLNIGGLVEITVTDTAEQISAFLHALIQNKPIPAEIVHVKREVVSYRDFTRFTIIKSDDGDDEIAMIPADLAICPDCLTELYDETNPRHQHPFISCMACGPRYTIIDRFPYDRENTTMADFPMCDFCAEEYTDLRDRRYHAQTISCHSCGPQLLWKSASGGTATFKTAATGRGDIETYDKEASSRDTATHGEKFNSADAAILDHAAAILKNGGVILFKSVGGYNLVADPLSDKAVAKLRRIKKRETKPFAVMFRDIEQIRRFCHADPVEEKLLESSARPILLLEHKLKQEHSDDHTAELKRSRFIGSFLPSFAAQYMLLDRISPLIFTSANLSDLPMIKDDEEASALLDQCAVRSFAADTAIDGMLYNARRILVRADDSVARVIDGQPQMIRRSKGYAPVPLYINTNMATSAAISESSTEPTVSKKDFDSAAIKSSQIFAAGSQLKNSFALTKGNFVYMSQFFGDMDTLENQQVYEENFHRLQDFFHIKPAAVVCDLHPLYFTTRFAEAYAAKHALPLIKVQHHHAHVASVIAENDLKGKVIGVSFDGTGYGTDGNIWGGEFFLCEGAEAERIAHLRYVDMIGGDSSVKDAIRSALSYMHAYGAPSPSASGAPEQAKAIPQNAIDPAVSGHPDPVTLDLSDIIAYGNTRLLSHPTAELVIPALKAGINTVKSSSMGRLFDAVSALLGICDYNDYEGQCAILLEDAAAFAQKHPGEKENCDLALSFHHRIIDMIVEQCRYARQKYGADQVALTGGTFQNKILMEGVLAKLRADGFHPYYNISVSPNDGGIALGQAYIAMHADLPR